MAPFFETMASHAEPFAKVRQVVSDTQTGDDAAINELEDCLTQLAQRHHLAKRAYYVLIGSQLREWVLSHGDLRSILASGLMHSHMRTAYWARAMMKSFEQSTSIRQDAALKEIPLGRRRWLARFADSDLDNLGRDIDPIVINHLLTNPRLKESQVIAIASRETTPSAILNTIALSHWLRRSTVCTALCNNRRLSEGWFLLLLPLLDKKQLSALVEAYDFGTRNPLKEAIYHRQELLVIFDDAFEFSLH